MKRIGMLLLTLAMLFSLAACGAKDTQTIKAEEKQGTERTTSGIAVKPGVLGNTHHLIVQLAQYDAAVFADIGHQIKDALHLRFLHETSRSVGAFVGVGQVALRVILPNIGIAHAHHHDDQQAQQQQAKPYADEPALTEQCFAAGGEGQHRRGRGASVAWRSARVLPLLIVSDELR